MTARTLLVAVALLGACRRSSPPAPPPPDAGPDPLAAVVDPWSWARAREATGHERAVEVMGPHERDGDVAVNVNAHSWTRLVDLAWDRHFSLVLDREPVDLDGDGTWDVRVSRRIDAPGGILANPRLFGLVPTPHDPRGRVGRVSASTGVLGLREALDETGRRTGLVGMTCWICHGGASPVDGSIVYGLPGTRFDYGLLLATSSLLDDDRVLDLDGDDRADPPAAILARSPAAAGKRLDLDGDGRVTAGEYRRALGFSPGRTVRARLLLAGPGRQDLTGEFGLDLGVPGLHSGRYPGTLRMRQGSRGLVNPVSVPSIFATGGLALENWSGSEVADEPWLERLAALSEETVPQTIRRFRLPDEDLALARRALLLDLRNLGTLGLQQDSFPGLLWSDMLRGRALPSASVARRVPSLYAAAELRQLVASAEGALVRPPLDPAAVARGRQIFAERITGEIANRQIAKRVPAAYAAARLAPPVIMPIDPSRPLEAKLAVRCADCHNGSLLEARIALGPETGLPLGRCSHCHLGHPADGVEEARAARGRVASEEVAVCSACHRNHRGFGPVAFSSGMLLPFDADGDGNAQGDEADDRHAGGIGTEALLAFDVPRADRPDGRFGVELAVLPDPRRAGSVTRVTSGVGWVRVAPLVAVFATAPYLHNGSVPTLRALLDPAARRSASFRPHDGAFVLDTRQPGNRNIGHEFGTRLAASEKDDLVAFLKSL